MRRDLSIEFMSEVLIGIYVVAVVVLYWRSPLWAGLLLGGLIVVYYLAAVSFIMRTIAVVYTAFMIPAVIFWHGRRHILVFFVGAALGTLGEYICIKLGFWHYHYPFFRSLGVPVSLPLAWGLSSVIAGRIAGIWEKAEEAGLSS